MARLHGTSPANVGHAFNSGMSKIAEEVLLQMTGKKPRPEALLQLVKSEEFGLAVAEIMREGTLIVEGAPLPQGRTSPSIQEGGGGAPEARPQREKNDP